MTRYAKVFLTLVVAAGLTVGLHGMAWAELSAQDKADISRVEDLLNGIQTLQARFTQLSDNGGTAEGVFYLQRPGRLRFEYDPPTPILIVGTGKTIVFYDSRLGQVTYVPIKSTPLGFLVDETISFSGDTEVVRVDREPGALAITLADKKGRRDGTITLIFSDSPLRLRMWRVTDAQGKVTTIALSGMRTNLTLDAELFRFVNPDPFGQTSGDPQ
ncbi:MAG: outer membrane lipoprotein carrier protein LolA [Proteobacteria bacterium]|nr:outer membrane lipoprotein carrier protein LolA [Pseudomonadota bacterium]